MNLTNLLKYRRGVNAVTVVPGTTPEIPLKGKLLSTPFNHQGKDVVFFESGEPKKWPTNRSLSVDIKKIVID